MKYLKLKVALLAIISLYLTACKKDYSNTPDGFKNLEQDLKKKFGENAFYTRINLAYDRNVGSIINLTVTKEPSSLKMEEWGQLKGAWEKKSDVTLEVSGGKASDFMFDLVKDASLIKVGELVEAAKKQLSVKKGIQEAVSTLVSISSNDRSKSDLQYFIKLEPKDGGTSFSFTYDLKGNLTNFDY